MMQSRLSVRHWYGPSDNSAGASSQSSDDQNMRRFQISLRFKQLARGLHVLDCKARALLAATAVIGISSASKGWDWISAAHEPQLRGEVIKQLLKLAGLAGLFLLAGTPPGARGEVKSGVVLALSSAAVAASP